ncbi:MULTISPECIES: LCP family protein [Thermoactinomyces]|uniref:LCP family protein n=1 Tax=Thermoactinomyces daqus TaxID=1329516 RepID=A0A7W1X822_9BACL|nr:MULTISPECIES: LCP family protein [Thermoactinomyces]MBA4541803.1 LCP family protein [Thermoactinomyces daqus]MBH8597801.1 LCP family protein [Thermoactinomyces sp. CICC 10523]MBH8604152.1 LCP family protein [Thermoactinomyces sp. CICC 10522]
MKRRFLRILSVLIFAMVIAFAYYAYQIWLAMGRAYDPSTRIKSNKRQEAVSLTNDPVSILLLGVDERKGDIGRSDTIMIAAINPQTKTAILTNIPRDTLVKIPGREEKTKINHSYAYGGARLTRLTVENFLDLPIDAYVKINMQGLKEIVDELGGVDVEVPFDFTYEGVHFTKGPMHLNGNQALTFVRMRKADPNGDFGRIKRQQELIRAILQKGTNWGSLTKLDNVMEKLGDNIKTDIPPIEWIKLQNLYAGISGNRIKTVTFRGEDAMINGVYYFKISQQEVRRVHDILAKQLEYTE